MLCCVRKIGMVPESEGRFPVSHMQNVRSLPPAGRWTKANSASAMADVVCNNRGDAVGTVGGTCAGVLHSVSAGAGTSDIDNAMGKAAAEVHKNNRQARCPSSKDALFFWSTGVTRRG